METVVELSSFGLGALIVVPGLVSVVVGFLIGNEGATAYERSEAMSKDVGRYVVDEKTGATRFVYGVRK